MLAIHKRIHYKYEQGKQNSRWRGGEYMNKSITFKLSDENYAAISQAAKANNIAIASYVRMVMVKHAEQEIK